MPLTSTAVTCTQQLLRGVVRGDKLFLTLPNLALLRHYDVDGREGAIDLRHMRSSTLGLSSVNV